VADFQPVPFTVRVSEEVLADLRARIRQAQTSALKSALAALSTAVSNLAASPSTSAVSGVVTALGGQHGGEEPPGRCEHGLSLRILIT
jgi:hypothetical protein